MYQSEGKTEARVSAKKGYLRTERIVVAIDYSLVVGLYAMCFVLVCFHHLVLKEPCEREINDVLLLDEDTEV